MLGSSIQHESNSLPSTQKIINYITKDLNEEDIKLSNFSGLLTLASTFGLLSSIMYYPGGIELAKLWSQNYPSQIAAEIAFVFGGVGSNTCVNTKIFYDVIREIAALTDTPEDLKELIPTQYSPKEKIVLGTLATIIGTISLMPTVAFVFGTNAHNGKVHLTGAAWFDFITSLASNLVLNTRSILAMSKEQNPLFLKSINQLMQELWIKCTKSDIELNRFHKNLQLEYVERKIYSTIFDNFCEILKNNYENKPLEALLTNPQLADNKKKKSDFYKISQSALGFSMCGSTLFSLLGYFVGTYLILKSWFPNNIASSIVTAITNFFFVYLVMKFTYSTTAKIFDMGMNLVSRGYDDYKKDFPNWFHARENSSLLLFLIFVSMALLSFPSGVDLFYQDFNNTGGNNTNDYSNHTGEYNPKGMIISGTITTILSSCLFNGSGAPDVIELICLLTILIKSKFNSALSDKTKLVSTDNDYNAKAIHDEKIARKIVQLRRLPEKTFLTAIADYIENESNLNKKDECIRNLSSGKIESLDTLKTFLNSNIIPNRYQETPATYHGRFFKKTQELMNNTTDTEYLAYDHEDYSYSST